MIQWLDNFISIHSLVWLFLAAFMLHDFEEIIRVESFFNKHADGIYKKLPKRFHDLFRGFAGITSAQFAVVVCIELILFIPVTFLAAEHEAYIPFLGINAVLLLHVFMHVGQAVIVGKLVPGVVTALMITLPYSVYLFYRLLDAKLINTADILLSVPIGLLLIPIVLGGHKAGKKLVPASSAMTAKADEIMMSNKDT